jgi:diguanylate cyclase (GGDEF)-like protein
MLKFRQWVLQRRVLQRPKLRTVALAPLVALVTTLVVSLLGIRGLVTGASALQSALGSANSAHELEAIASGVQEINGDLYHVLTLRGAQTKGYDAAADLHKLLAESDQVEALLRAWRDTRAVPAQRPRVDGLIVSVERYKGAVDFESQMLDVDFGAAVSFIRPFDQNFRDLMQAVTALVREVQARQRADADAALLAAATTKRVFEGVGATSILLALVAAANMGWASVRSHRLTRQNSVLTRLTQVDALTGLGNRRCFDETLAGAWATCTARQMKLTLVMFDIDHFKKFNDSQGHAAGDACLRTLAAVVPPCRRGDVDTAARYGGEEFAIIMPGASVAAGRAVAERVRLAVIACAVPHPAAGPPGVVTVSLGVATMVPTATGSVTTLIEAADKDLYAAKRAGRNRVGDAAAQAEAVPERRVAAVVGAER